MQELISIIIPTYNREGTILKSINSVLNQTYKNIEIIIIDDASTDNTYEIIKNIKDQRIRYFKLTENKGACHARNFGIEKANGEYISFQDSDDEYLYNKIELQYKNLKLENSDLDFCKLNVYDNDNINAFPSNERIQSLKANIFYDEVCKENLISTQAILVRSDIIKKFLFDEQLPRLQDYDLILRMTKNIRVSFTNECLVNAYRQSDSISNNPMKLENAIEIMVNKEYNMNRIQQKNFLMYLYLLRKEYGVDKKKLIENVKEIAEYRTNEHEYNRILEEKNNEIECMKNEINKLKLDNDTCRVEIKELKEINEKILESNSWKITKPLRDFVICVKKLKK